MDADAAIKSLRAYLSKVNTPPTDEEIASWDTLWGFSQRSITELSRHYAMLKRLPENDSDISFCNALNRYSKSQVFKDRYAAEVRGLENFSANFAISQFPISSQVKVVKTLNLSRTIVPVIGSVGTVVRHSWQFDRYRWQELHDQYGLVWVKFDLPIYDQDGTIWLAEGDIDSREFYDAVVKKYSTTSVGIYGTDQPLIVGYKIDEIVLVN